MLDHRLNDAVEPEAKVARTWTWIASPRLGGRNHGMHVNLPVAENDRRIVGIACFEFSQVASRIRCKSACGGSGFGE